MGMPRWITKLFTPAIIVAGIATVGISMSNRNSSYHERVEWEKILTKVEEYSSPMKFQTYDDEEAWKTSLKKNINEGNTWQKHRSQCIKTLKHKIESNAYGDDVSSRAKSANEPCLVIKN